jgi:hypothetical protein
LEITATAGGPGAFRFRRNELRVVGERGGDGSLQCSRNGCTVRRANYRQLIDIDRAQIARAGSM